VNGELFKTDEELVDAMEKMILDVKKKDQKAENLLPEMFRQNTCIHKMLRLINDV